jgi:hypothetical protein
MARLGVSRSFNHERQETHERVGGEGGFKTRPYISEFFFCGLWSARISLADLIF